MIFFNVTVLIVLVFVNMLNVSAIGRYVVFDEN